MSYGKKDFTHFQAAPDVCGKGDGMGNLVFAGLVIAQFVPGTTPFRFGLLVAGILNFLGAYLIAYYLTRGGEQAE